MFASVVVAVVLGYALWWRRNPSACPYKLRFFVELPHPFIMRARLREVLAPRPGDRVLEVERSAGMAAEVPAKMNILTLGVRDLPKVRAFYEALGWESLSEGEDFARFRTGGATLALFSLELLAGEAGMRPAPEEDTGRFGGFTCACLVEEEAMVDEAIEKVHAAGDRVLAEPVAREWGGRSGYFADPEGNAWELAWMPGATFDERGALIWPQP